MARTNWVNRVPPFLNTDTCNVTKKHFLYILLKPTVRNITEHHTRPLSASLLRNAMTKSNMEKVLFGTLKPSDP